MAALESIPIPSRKSGDTLKYDARLELAPPNPPSSRRGPARVRRDVCAKLGEEEHQGICGRRGLNSNWASSDLPRVMEMDLGSNIVFDNAAS